VNIGSSCTMHGEVERKMWKATWSKHFPKAFFAVSIMII